MQRLVSISEIEKKFETNGSRPILVLANDFEHYICKYPHFPNDSKLINEYLANQFARIWGIYVPANGICGRTAKAYPRAYAW